MKQLTPLLWLTVAPLFVLFQEAACVKLTVLVRSNECIDEYVSESHFQAGGNTPADLVGRLMISREEGYGWPTLNIKVYGPSGTELYSQVRVGPEVTITVPAEGPGNYKLCVHNDHTSRADAYVDILYLTLSHLRSRDIQLPRGSASVRNQKAAHVSQLEEARSSIVSIAELLEVLAGEQKYMERRLERHQRTNVSTNRRAMGYALLEVLAVVGIACMQIYTIRNFFDRAPRRSIA